MIDGLLVLAIAIICVVSENWRRRGRGGGVIYAHTRGTGPADDVFIPIDHTFSPRRRHAPHVVTPVTRRIDDLKRHVAFRFCKNLFDAARGYYS